MVGLTESAEVREAIVRALRLDLIGPWADHPLSDERLPGWVRPSNWYLTGFLVPREAPIEHRGDADADDEPEVAESGGLGDDSTEDRRAAKKGFFPSSMGLSFLVSEEVEAVDVLRPLGRLPPGGGGERRPGPAAAPSRAAKQKRNATSGRRPRISARAGAKAGTEPTARAAMTSRRTPASTEPARVKSEAGGNARPAPNRSE